MIKYMLFAILVTLTGVAHAACPNQITSISLVAGGPPVHITARNATTCAADPPGSVTWALSGPAASSVTITPDATGFNFTAAPASSGTATASTMGTNLAITISPLGTLTAPPGAQAAGYTTLALNTDWEKQTFPLNWLGACPNGSIPVNTDNGQSEMALVPYGQDNTGHTWWANIWWSYGNTGCTYTITVDPTFGNTALDLAYNNRNNSYDGVGNVIQTASVNYNASTGVGQANSFPHGSYYEITYRITPVGDARNYIVLNTWGPDGIANGNCGCAVEWDVMETDDNNLGLYDTALHNWGQGNTGGFILFPWTNLAPGTNFDATQYNKIGMRVTYDGNNLVGCTYINDVFQKCSALNAVNATEQTERNFLVLQKACDTWNGACTQGDIQHGYIKSVRVWSCAGWATTQCNGALLSGPP